MFSLPLMQGVPAASNLRRVCSRLVVFVLTLGALASTHAARWVTGGPVNTARYLHTTTLLLNGKVLIAGGWNESELSSAELFDPRTGSWTNTAAMTDARSDHTATLLQNGKVLVAGGYGTGSPATLGSAELYDPVAGTWTPTGSMANPRVFHTATLLPNGKVLVTGGSTTGGILKTAELYDPASGTWTLVASMQSHRWYHSATVLTNGTVLVAGGVYKNLPGADLLSVEIFNPASGLWTSTGPMTTNRSSHTATLLPDGRVLAVGGMAPDTVNGGLQSLWNVEVYDPGPGTWTAANSLSGARGHHTATLLPHGKLLVVAGFKEGPGALGTVESFDPVSALWSTNLPLAKKRFGHSATLLADGRVLVAGGLGTFSVTNVTELYDEGFDPNPATNAATPYPLDGRQRHTATLLPNRTVLIAGGFTSPGDYVGRTMIYNLSNSIWSWAGDLPYAADAQTMTFLPNGKVLVTGGYGEYGVTNAVHLYDYITGAWTNGTPMLAARQRHTATLLRNGKVLVAGGYAAGGAPLQSAELYDPDTGTWTATGSMTHPRGWHSATMLMNGNVLAAGGSIVFTYGAVTNTAELYDPATGQWRKTGSMPFRRYAHSATLLPNGNVLVAGGGDDYFYAGTTLAHEYVPATGTWLTVGAMNSARLHHAATLLLNGKVLVSGGQAGGSGSGAIAVNTAELYDPVTRTWGYTFNLNVGRTTHTATLLPDGRVLITGGGQRFGNSSLGSFWTSEIYDSNLGRPHLARPNVTSFNSSIAIGETLTAVGTGFRGISEAGGSRGQGSPTDYPLLQLRSMGNSQTVFLHSTNWSATSFESLPVWNFPPGFALATVFVNASQSTSRLVKVTVPVPAASVLLNARVTNGAFGFDFTNTPGAVFGVVAATNLALPAGNWTPLSGVAELAPGQFYFSDPRTNGYARRFYRVQAR